MQTNSFMLCNFICVTPSLTDILGAVRSKTRHFQCDSSTKGNYSDFSSFKKKEKFLPYNKKLKVFFIYDVKKKE